MYKYSYLTIHNSFATLITVNWWNFVWLEMRPTGANGIHNMHSNKTSNMKITITTSDQPNLHFIAVIFAVKSGIIHEKRIHP